MVIMLSMDKSVAVGISIVDQEVFYFDSFGLFIIICMDNSALLT